MADSKPPDNHEEIRVRIERAQREILPAVSLERKEIRMTNLPPEGVPCIVMISEDESRSRDAVRIVGNGTGPRGVDERRPQMGVPIINGHEIKIPSSPKPGSRLTVEQAAESPKEKLENTYKVIEFFEEQEKSLQEQFRTMPKKTMARKPRTPSHSPVRQSIGLDHLDNLVKLMEQLGSLKDENKQLKRRCAYLESTKTLLEVKSNLDEDSYEQQYKSDSLPRSRSKSKHKSAEQSGNLLHAGLTRPRLPSAEDAHFMELIDTNSEQAPKRPRHGKLKKRSYSTGSLEVPSDIVEQSEDDIPHKVLSKSYEKSAKVSSKISKSPETKRKSKSKWAKVKKKLTGQVTESISSGIKSVKEFGKGGYFRYGSVTSTRELTVPSVSESRSVDSGVGSGVEAEALMDSIRKSTSSGEVPPSPTSQSGFFEKHITVPETKAEDVANVIWLGPPEWIEKHEREQKMLEEQEKQLSLDSSEVADLMISQSLSPTHAQENGQSFLDIPIARRQSSPSLLEDAEDEEDLDPSVLHRSSSYKDAKELDGMEEEEEYLKSDSVTKLDKEKKMHKTPWGVMKGIIHTRKDSVKKKIVRKGKSEFESFGTEELSEIDLEGIDELRHSLSGEGPVSRSTPKTSPVTLRQKTRDKSSSTSPPGAKTHPGLTKVPTVGGGSIDVSLLLGGVSDKFTRKLQEWESMKTKRTSTSYRETSDYSEGISYESAGAVSPEFLKKLEEWEKVKSLKGLSEKPLESQTEQEGDSSSEGSPEGASTPPERHQSINVEEMQRKLTDSFNRKLQEWEKRKYRRDTTHSFDQRDLTQRSTFKGDRQKSKKSKEEKEKGKLEKMRERELQRVERETQKLEKERLRIEKERLRALEREAKIEKMKGRLSQPDMESKYKNPILSPLTEYKVTSDFARKLHEWEVIKGRDISTAMYLEAQKRSQQFAFEYKNATDMLGSQQTDETAGEPGVLRRTSSESDNIFLMDEEAQKPPARRKKGKIPPPLTLEPYYDTPEERSPIDHASDDESSLDDHTTVTMDESMTQSNITSLERANASLLDELRQRELEYMALQDEVEELNDKLARYREEHSRELEDYKRELLAGRPSAAAQFDTQHMPNMLANLEQKIGELKSFGEKLTTSMESAAMFKFQNVEGEENINHRLINLLDKMRLMLHHASSTEEMSKKSSALHHFEKLYSQAMQLQVQMNNLRLSQLERNKEILGMKRHLLLQEANNLLLQADVTRREAELYHYKQYARKGTPIKRWNTYSGSEDMQRAMEGREMAEKPSIFKRITRLRSTARAPIASIDSESDEDRRDSTGKISVEEKLTRFVKEHSSSRSPVEKTAPDKVSDQQDQGDKTTKYSEKIPEKVLKYPEKSTDRSEKLLKGQQEQKVVSETRQVEGGAAGGRGLEITCTITLPTASITLPKDISPQELRVPRSHRLAEAVPPSQSQLTAEERTRLEQIPSIDDVEEKQKSSSGPKFPELLIPEWRKKDRSKLQRSQNVEPDDVFESDSEVFLEANRSFEQNLEIPLATLNGDGLKVDTSFDSSASSEDTLKRLSPASSPVHASEAPRFPEESHISYIQIGPRSKSLGSPVGRRKEKSELHMTLDSTGSPTLLRKPPLQQVQSRKLNIPVIPLRRIKPAQELLEDSKKYRSGHSIYLTRILKRYPMKIEYRSLSLEEQRTSDKENIKAGHVKAIVNQLSREGTPGRSHSPRQISTLSLTRAEQAKTQSEFVQHIVRKLSYPRGPVQDKGNAPLKDLTNDGQVRTLTEAFGSGSSRVSPERTYSPVEYSSQRSSLVVTSQHLKAYESSSSAASNFTISHLSTQTEPVPDSTISDTVNFSSMPMLNLGEDGENGHRERASTTTGASASRDQESAIIHEGLSHKRQLQLSLSASPLRQRKQPIIVRGEEILESSQESIVPVAQTQISHTSTFPVLKKSEVRKMLRKSPRQKGEGKIKMGTIGALCKQSLTFDLGVSLQSPEKEEGPLPSTSKGTGSQSEESDIRHSSTSSQSESESAPTSERKKTRKFLDANWIQKSRKFFKVSKS